MVPINTYTNTYTYTTTRIQVLDDHFELFLRCSGMPDQDVEKMIEAVERQEVVAVGIYISDSGFRIAEVEFEVDWEEHKRQIGIHGDIFDADLPGFKDNVSPEAYVAVQRLVKAAEGMKKSVRSWIRVSPQVRNDTQKHQEVCKQLGYSYGSSVEPWKEEPIKRERPVNYLPEAKVIQRTARQ